MTRFASFKNVVLALAVLPLTLAATCPPSSQPVTIAYEQVGACNGYQQGAGPISAGPKAAFVAFRILTIDNSQSGVDFAFDPERISVSGQNVDTSLSLAQDFGLLKAVAVTVPKGTTPTNSGIAVIHVSTGTTSGAVEANQSDYLLQYDRAAGDPLVVMDKQGKRSDWPLTEDCRAIHF